MPASDEEEAMGTAAAPSTTPSAETGLPGREGLPHQHRGRARPQGRVEVTFEIAPPGSPHDVSPRDAGRVSGMRRITRAFLGHHGLTVVEFEVTLIVSELVTNAVVHSRGADVGFTLALGDGRLRIAVRNSRAGVCAPRSTGDADEHGRGPHIVAATVHELGGAWGVEDDGMTVACSFPVPGEDLVAGGDR
ncbi:ATP-binding protein [Streptomyces sp. NPDC048290]|uniref:ATP-binding protein n=1 Tax=Streptomyces sp. NPDC048290 TaxID=3155811 RepID=UPI003415B039